MVLQDLLDQILWTWKAIVLSMRENGSFDEWSDIFNVTVNGTFAIQQQLSAQSATFGAGEVEVRLRFNPFSISATDDANLSSKAPYKLQSFLQFEFESTPQLEVLMLYLV